MAVRCPHAATVLGAALLAGLLVGGCSQLGLDGPKREPVPALERATADSQAGTEAPTRQDAALAAAVPERPEPVDETYVGRSAAAPTPGGPTGVQGGGGDLTVSFQDTDLRQVLRVVLGDLLGFNYVLDSRIEGKVTLRTVRPLNRQQMLRTVDGLLTGFGLTAIYEGNLVRVVPVAAAAGSAPFRPAGAGQPGYGVDVVPLQHTSVALMLQLLKPVVRDGAVTSGGDGARVLLVAGTASERESTRRAIAVLDIDQMAGQSVALVGLAHAEPATVIDELDQLFGDTAKGPLAGLVRFIAVDRMNAILAIARAPEHLSEARTWIKRLDRSIDADRRQLHVYFVKHRTAAALVDTLRGVFEENAGPRIAGPRQPSPAATPGEATTAPRVVPAAVADATGRGDRPQFMADTGANAILAWATGREYEVIAEALTRLDLTPLQVIIEGTVIEITLRDALRFGLQYFIESGEFSSIFTRGTNQTGVNPLLPGLGVSIGTFNDSKVVIDALSELTDVRVVSSPQIMVLDGGTARLHVGDQVPVVTRASSTTVTDSTRIVNEIEYRDTGVTLKVTPKVKASGVVQMEIVQEVSDVVPTTTSGIDSPTIQQRSISSQTAVDSGQTVLLAGLIREENTKSDTGIPGLRRLPVVGPLFGTTNRNAERTELVVLITPRVIRGRADAADATRELLKLYKGVLEDRGAAPAAKPGP